MRDQAAGITGVDLDDPHRVVAEMVANVLSVSVAPGDRVAVGEPVVLLESMKMEIPVLTETAGTVAAVKVSESDVVQEGDVLVTIEL